MSEGIVVLHLRKICGRKRIIWRTKPFELLVRCKAYGDAQKPRVETAKVGLDTAKSQSSAAFLNNARTSSSVSFSCHRISTEPYGVNMETFVFGPLIFSKMKAAS